MPNSTSACERFDLSYIGEDGETPFYMVRASSAAWNLLWRLGQTYGALSCLAFAQAVILIPIADRHNDYARSPKLKTGLRVNVDGGSPHERQIQARGRNLPTCSRGDREMEEVSRPAPSQR